MYQDLESREHLSGQSEAARKPHEEAVPPPAGSRPDVAPDSCCSSKKADLRRMRYRLQREARRLLEGERVGSCMRKRTGQTVSVVKTEHGAHLGGVAICGSVWHCPVCSAKISERRRAEVEDAVQQWLEAGNSIAMLTLTVPHEWTDPLADLKASIQKAKQALRNGKPWRKLRDRIGLFGEIAVMEVTVGQNGWHPHFHLLLFIEGQDTTGPEIEAAIYESWRDKAVKQGLSEPTRQAGVHATVRNDPGAAPEAARYATKELAYGQKKKGNKGGKSPFQLLERIAEIEDGGGPQTEAQAKEKALTESRFCEYAQVMKGQRQMRWTDGLKDYFGIDADKTDEEVAEEEQESGETLVELGREGWKRVVAENAQAHILDLAEHGGRDAVLGWLRARGLSEASEVDRRSAYGWRFDDPV